MSLSTLPQPRSETVPGAANLRFRSAICEPVVLAVAVAVAPPQVNEHTISKSSVAASVEKVSLTVYYSSQSVRSANFIAYNLMKILENGLIDFVDLKLVPFGKSRLLKNGTILCERGSKECELNRLQACAMNVIPGAYNYYYPFIYCTEVIVSEGKTTEDWLQCLEVGNQYKDSIYKCFTNGLGEKLQLHNAKVTASLNPHLEFVPWVTVNDLPIRHDTRNFIRYVCKAYRRGAVPYACRGEIRS
ncbi:hypothetical protein C5167_039943 [Papaver somniferum]|uniref:Gamma-interferon-inducible lysosomal thiol reductase n=1 Tax=Papaver somniferum TaxID=3469 RepID=A0A4Y7IDI8_PAPSO|nr:hypothetical protein C5167_039943 [Papaver somniferum]